MQQSPLVTKLIKMNMNVHEDRGVTVLYALSMISDQRTA
jgi:hypothetical protein